MCTPKEDLRGRTVLLCCSGGCREASKLAHPPQCSSSLFGSRLFGGTDSRGNEEDQQRGSLCASVKQIQVLNLKNLASPGRVVSMVNFLFGVSDFSFHYV